MNKNIEEAKKYIDSINFASLIDKLVNHSGWLRSDALETCEQYKNFLFLHKKYPEQNFPPSEDIDEFWHNHILDTNAYIKDCEMIFGRYLHHYPYFGIDGKSNMNDLYNAFEKTQEIYSKEFGSRIEATRSRFPHFIYYILIRFEKIYRKFSRNSLALNV